MTGSLLLQLQEKENELAAKNLQLTNLQKKLEATEKALTHKNYYLAKLELDLEHAINQCQSISKEKKLLKTNQNQWINRSQPGLDSRKNGKRRSDIAQPINNTADSNSN